MSQPECSACGDDCEYCGRARNYDHRKVVALESIAQSLATLAGPRVRGPKPLPEGHAKCPHCPAVLPEGLMEQHHKEIHAWCKDPDEDLDEEQG